MKNANDKAKETTALTLNWRGMFFVLSRAWEKIKVSIRNLTSGFFLTHCFCRCKLPVQLNREFFISGPIGVHYSTLEILIWQLNNLSNTRFGKKRTYHFSSDNFSFRVNDGSIPKFWTKYELCLENENYA